MVSALMRGVHFPILDTHVQPHFINTYYQHIIIGCVRLFLQRSTNVQVQGLKHACVNIKRTCKHHKKGGTCTTVCMMKAAKASIASLSVCPRQIHVADFLSA